VEIRIAAIGQPSSPPSRIRAKTPRRGMEAEGSLLGE
jgi:hypothetical protein